MKHLLALAAAALVFGGGAVCLIGYKNATRPPIVRYLSIRATHYPLNAPPVRILFLSDLHVHGPDMPPARVAEIVHQVNGLHPDIVIVGGDFVGDNWVGAHFPISEAIAPLTQVRARLGVFAVLGNNDYEAGRNKVALALRRAGVDVLVNEVARAGPIAIGGIDGDIHVPGAFWRERRNRTLAALQHLPGTTVLVAHRPDEFNWTPPWVTLVLAGHTHCGQIVLPLFGPLVSGSDFGSKYLCGIIRYGSKLMVVTGGVGTSHVPLRIGAPADIWLITVSRA